MSNATRKRGRNRISASHRRTIFPLTARQYRMDALEQRVFLSVSSSILADPDTAPGNVATYQQLSPTGSVTQTNTSTVIGATTFNSLPAVEVDTATTNTGGSSSIQRKAYIAQTDAGLVDYGETSQSFGLNNVLLSSQVTSFATPVVLFPAQLIAGQDVAQSTVETDTITDANGAITISTITLTGTGHLVSDKTQSITVPVGTFDCYQFIEHQQRLNQNGLSHTHDITIFVAQDVGKVEQLDSLDGGSPVTQQLSAFTASDRLVFQQPPTNVSAGDPIKPAITVALQDSIGNVVTTNSSSVVTLSILGVNAANPITGTTATLVNGVATFSDVVLTKAGVYQLQATDSTSDLASTVVKFGVGGDKLKFVTQPKDADVDAPLTVKVEVDTPNGKIDTAATDSVQLDLNIISGGLGAVLAGTPSGPLGSGVITFAPSAGISINSAGTYTLTATAVTDDGTGLLSTDFTTTAATSINFNVTGLQLAIKKQPAKASDPNVPIPFSVQVENSKHQVDKTNFTDTVQITMNTVSGGVGANLRGTTSMTLQAGVANFLPIAAPSITVPGVYTFTLSVPGSTSINSITTPAFTVSGLHLAFAKTPRTVDIQTPFAFTVSLRDSKNKVVTTENTASVALSFNVVSTKAAVPSLTGTVTGTLTAGVVAFTPTAGPMFSDPGIYTLTAIETGVATGGAPVNSTLPATSPPISATRFHLELLTKPKNVNVNDVIPTSIAVEASNNTIRFSENTDIVQITLNTVTGGQNARLTGITSLQLKGGSADFPNLAITAAGTYTLTYTEIDPSTGEPSDATVPLTTKPIKVQGLHLAVIIQPTDILPYQTIPLKFAIENAQNKIDTAADTYVLSESLVVIHGSSGAALSRALDSFSFTNGVADLTSNAQTSITNNPGTFEIQATVTPINPDAAAVDPVKTHPFKVAPLHMVITQQPATAATHSVIHSIVALETSSGKIDVYDTDNDILDTTLNDIDSGTEGLLISDTPGDVRLYFVGGQVDLSNNDSGQGGTRSLGAATPGNYSLTFAVVSPLGVGTNSPDVAPVTTSPFKVLPIQLAITQQPANVAVGAPLSFQVQIQDSTGAPVARFVDALTLDIDLNILNGGTGAALNRDTVQFDFSGNLLFQEGIVPGMVSINAPGTYQLVLSLSAGVLVSGTIPTMLFTVT